MTRSEQDGFILPAVLWIIAGLALIAAVTTQWVSAGVENARARQTEVDGERLMFEAQAQILYQLTTSNLSMRGLEVSSPNALPTIDVFAGMNNASGPYVALDDRPYTLDGIEVRMQDCRGLLNLNLAGDDEIFRLLGVMGIPLEARGPLIAKLKDYISPGDLMRLNGAKRNEYLAAGRQPPTYLPLVTPYEAQYVMDWDKYPNLWAETNGLPAVTTTGSGCIGTNINTASPKVLALIEGLNPQAVEKLVIARQTTQIRSIQDVHTLSGVTILDNPLRYIFFPADTIRVRLRVPGRALERVVVIHITPQAVPYPWRIDYSIDVPPLTDYDPDSIPPPFPLATATAVSLAP